MRSQAAPITNKARSFYRLADNHRIIALTLDLVKSSAVNLDFKTKDPHASQLNQSASASVGAVRRRPDAPQQPRRKLPLKKFAMFSVSIATLGLMATSATHSNGAHIPTESALKVAALFSPTFFFDDATNALGQGQQLLKPGELLPPASTSNSLLPMVNTAEYVASPTLLDDLNALTPQSLAGEEPARTVTVSSLVNHPTITAMRQKAEAPSNAIEKVFTVSAGDTLSGILNDHGIAVDQMQKVLSDNLVNEHLATLRIGQKMNITQHRDGRFHSLTAKVGHDKRITVRQTDDDFAVASIDLPIEKERVVTSGTIEHSLYAAAEQAKLKQSTIMELADIFEWELDFSRDIRKGDQFSIVFDRLYREGKYIGDGDILAAEFVQGGRAFRAVRFTTDDGKTNYYSPDGRSKRRTFLRHPVDVVRITSRFDPNRMHPVLHQIRAHRGVDYGAPYGSPIYATADGTIKKSGFQNAYGNVVTIQHGNSITTLYAHMSKIAKSAREGARVSQGQIIGYVGKTGRVTGTHLHYEFRKNGKHKDPLKVRLPESAAIDPKYRDSLRTVADELIAQMRSVIPDEPTELASAN